LAIGHAGFSDHIVQIIKLGVAADLAAVDEGQEHVGDLGLAIQGKTLTENAGGEPRIK